MIVENEKMKRHQEDLYKLFRLSPKGNGEPFKGFKAGDYILRSVLPKDFFGYREWFREGQE